MFRARIRNSTLLNKQLNSLEPRPALRHMWAIRWLISSLVFVCAVLVVHADEGRDPSRISHPNIVLLLVDDMGFGDLGAFGNITSRTPNIDALAASGLKLTQFLSAAAICTPSRAALLTGRYPVRSGMASSQSNFRTLNSPAQPSGLPTSEITIPKMLKTVKFQHKAASGVSTSTYRTGMFGKWHLGMSNGSLPGRGHLLPVQHGFDEYFGMPVTNVQACGKKATHLHSTKLLFFFDRVGAKLLGGGAGAAVLLCALAYHGLITRLRTYLALAVVLTVAIYASAYYYTISFTLLNPLSCVLYRNTEVIEQPVRLPGLTQRIVNATSHFISRHKHSPFFAFVPFMKLHTALFTSEERRGRSGAGNFVDNVEELDWAVGAIMQRLRDEQIINNTLVILTSDNGPFLERGHEAGTSGFLSGSDGARHFLRGGKGQNWEGGIRVPAVISWPTRIQPGSNNQPVSMMDIYSTIASVSGARIPASVQIDSTDLSPLLFSADSERPQCPIGPDKAYETSSEDLQSCRAVHQYMFHYCGQDVTAMRAGRYKLHFRTTYFEIPLADQYTAHSQLFEKHQCRECCPNSVLCGCDGPVHDPPLLFDLSTDPGEQAPLDTAKYPRVMQAALHALQDHKHSVVPVTNQLERLALPQLFPCCNQTDANCLCCEECTDEERAAHHRDWSVFFSDYLWT